MKSTSAVVFAGTITTSLFNPESCFPFRLVTSKVCRCRCSGWSSVLRLIIRSRYLFPSSSMIVSVWGNDFPLMVQVSKAPCPLNFDSNRSGMISSGSRVAACGTREGPVVPERFRRLDPFRLALLVRVFDHDSHAHLAQLFTRLPKNPHARLVHGDDGIDAFGGSQADGAHRARRRALDCHPWRSRSFRVRRAPANESCWRSHSGYAKALVAPRVTLKGSPKPSIRPSIVEYSYRSFHRGVAARAMYPFQSCRVEKDFLVVRARFVLSARCRSSRIVREYVPRFKSCPAKACV